MYRAAILDIDGTIVDSNDAHAQAWVDALTESGRRVSFERVRPLIGIGTDKLLPRIAGVHPDTEEGRALVARRRDMFMTRYLPDLEPTRGARALLEWLRDERLTLVVATSAAPDEVHALLHVAQAVKLVDAITSSGDVAHSKPDPDVVSTAIARSGCGASDCIMLGDTPYDVEAARQAGVGIVALRCGGWSDQALEGALAIYDDPQDLIDHYPLSPFKRPLPAAPLRS
jgi:HAD superfamily hydrolase (TIGR01509 family)